MQLRQYMHRSCAGNVICGCSSPHGNAIVCDKDIKNIPQCCRKCADTIRQATDDIRRRANIPNVTHNEIIKYSTSSLSMKLSQSEIYVVLVLNRCNMTIDVGICNIICSFAEDRIVLPNWFIDFVNKPINNDFDDWLSNFVSDDDDDEFA